MKHILIIGCGNIGVRHLQGLLKITTEKLSIEIVEPSFSAIENAKEYERNENVNQHLIKYFENISMIRKTVDLTIMSTTAKNRLELVEVLLNKIKSINWILEKVLVQSTLQLGKLTQLLKGESVYVNHWMRMTAWPNNFKNVLNKQDKINIVYISGRQIGLMCNSTHYIDLIEYIFDTKLKKISLNNGELAWFPANRAGFYEAYGSICLLFENKIKCIISSNPDIQFIENYNFINYEGVSELELNYLEMMKYELKTSSRSEIFKQDLQSNLSKDFSIILNKSNNFQFMLPTLDMVKSANKIFLEFAIDEWKKNTRNKDVKIVPIT